MIPIVFWETLLGFGGGAVYAASKLTTALCGGDATPAPIGRRRAWSQFATALAAAPLITAVATDPVVNLAHRLAPWPAVAVAIGLSSNTLWPIFVGAVGEEMKGRLKAALDLIFNGPPKP